MTQNSKIHMEDNENDTLQKECLVDAIPKRFILFLLLFMGMISVFTMRSSMPLTLLAMVKEVHRTEQKSQDDQLCVKRESNGTSKTNYGGTLEWSMDAQYYVVTSFFWTYIVSQMFGGILAQKVSVKRILTFSLLTSAICNFAIPVASNIHYGLVILLRTAFGVAQAVVWPAYYRIISFWAPFTERSRFGAVFLGMSLGITAGQITAGFVISRLGWEYVFYVIGATGVVWVVLWCFFAFDTPENHPRITSKELKYIQDSRGLVGKKTNGNIPWKSIFTSLPIWAITITNFGRMWFNSIIVIYGSLYLKTVVGMDVESNGIWSGLPSTLAFFFAFGISYVSDHLTKHNYISLINNRRLFSGISQIIPSILSFSFPYINCNIPLFLIIWCAIEALPMACFSGSMVNVYDVAPNNAGPIMAFVQTILMSPNIIATYFAKTILINYKPTDAWKMIFSTASGINLLSVLFYFVFASAEVQTWDKKESINIEEGKEELDEDQMENIICDDKL